MRQHLSAGQYLAAAVVPITGSMKIRKKRMMMRSSASTSNNDQLNAELAAAAGGTSTSSLSTFVKKKLDHNAKERIRRMKLNASYLALRALLQLPHSTIRSKKRSWSAPSIVDKVLKYIPEMENEIQELESKKLNYINNVQLAAAKKKKKKKKIIYDNENENIGYPTISVNKINKGEVIVQICMPRSGTLAFTNLLQRVEDQLDDHQYIFCIKSLSTLYVCETRTCYHLHIQLLQMNHISDGADYIAELRDKLLSWLG
ncbi:hypothetical protein ACJIZ3_015757 [Penstemon smallii]|uniref:BHLH domain-containing protein n=1 Tax=Penstemon smallii TaxID=265156 RepID=A0ABD3RNF3_9LAMI